MRFFVALPVLLLVASSARAQEPPSQPDLPQVALEPSPAPSMGMQQAINTSLARNPNAIVALEEIRRAEAMLDQTRAASLPTLYGNGVYSQLDAARVLGPVVSQPASSLMLSATLTVPLIVPKPWAQWSQASDQVEAQRMSALDTRRLVAVSVARAYLTIVAQKRVIEAVVRARETDRAHYSYAHQRYAGGVGNRIDEVRAEQQVESDEATVQQQYAALERDREALGVLVGVGGPVDASEPNLQAPSDPEQAMKDAEHRSDVLAADVRTRAAKHAVRDDWTDYSPYLVGTFMPFYTTPSTVTYPTTGWEAQLLLTVPFYDAGLRYAEQKQRDVNRDEAEIQLDATLRQARSDVRTAFEEVKRADAALASSRRAADSSHTGLELANTSYRAGASTDIEVIDAERTARDAETAVAVAEDGARQARLDLLAATGRFP